MLLHIVSQTFSLTLLDFAKKQPKILLSLGAVSCDFSLVSTREAFAIFHWEPECCLWQGQRSNFPDNFFRRFRQSWKIIRGSVYLDCFTFSEPATLCRVLQSLAKPELFKHCSRFWRATPHRNECWKQEKGKKPYYVLSSNPFVVRNSSQLNNQNRSYYRVFRPYRQAQFWQRWRYGQGKCHGQSDSTLCFGEGTGYFCAKFPAAVDFAPRIRRRYDWKCAPA